VERLVQVGPRPVTVVADPVSRVYGAGRPAYTVHAVGLVPGETTADLRGLVVVGAPENAGVGSYAVTPSGVTNAEYDVTYVVGQERVRPAPLTVSAADKSRRYGAAPPTYTAHFQGLVNGDTPGDITGLRFSGPPVRERVGRYRIYVTSGTNPNYSYTYRSGTETITRAPLTITAHDVTVRAGQVAQYTYTAAPLVNGDLRVQVPPVCEAASDGVITCSGASDPDYDIFYVPGTLTVVP
jgi:hypothetical protein